ncbi:MAG: poly-beta,6-N-acetyl-D-glucosamine synthase [Patescibacteria group bacterium]|nr:poly-beta,6-N-acetyl-D-glucosamine synthase [Patescibacteria group bacterium]
MMFANIDRFFEIFLYPFIFLSLYFQVFMLYNFFSNKKKMKEEEDDFHPDFFPSVTFLLPGWNEGVHIKTTIESIQTLDYPKDKITIFYLDNNSSDNTKEIIEDLQSKDNRIKYIFELKQGKHNAMNAGLEHVNTELVACLDVDSTLDKRAMLVAAQYFKDDQIMALASCMQLRDVKTFWQRAQVIEYLLSVFWRKAYSSVDAMQVMPGPFSVFRKRVFEELGNYKKAHNAEDFEMTIRMQRAGYRIANAHKAYVYTVGPDTLRGLIKQRVRWIRGFLENTWDNKDMLFNKKYGNFGLFTLPFGVIFVFYVLYAVSFTVIRTLQLIYINIQNYFALGWHMPNIIPEQFDPFYITTDILFVQSIFILTILAIVFVTAKGITEDKRPFVFNFIVYLFIYPLVAPVFLFVATWKFLVKSENKWVLQDNKVVKS